MKCLHWTKLAFTFGVIFLSVISKNASADTCKVNVDIKGAAKAVYFGSYYHHGSLSKKERKEINAVLAEQARAHGAEVVNSKDAPGFLLFVDPKNKSAMVVMGDSQQMMEKGYGSSNNADYLNAVREASSDMFKSLCKKKPTAIEIADGLVGEYVISQHTFVSPGKDENLPIAKDDFYSVQVQKGGQEEVLEIRRQSDGSSFTIPLKKGACQENQTNDFKITSFCLGHADERAIHSDKYLSGASIYINQPDHGGAPKTDITITGEEGHFFTLKKITVK